MKKIGYLVGAVIAMMAIGGTYTSNGECLILSWNGWGLESFLCVCVFAYAVSRIDAQISLSVREKREKAGLLCLSAFLSLLILMGKTFAEHETIKVLFSRSGLWYSLINILGSIYMIYPLLVLAVCYLEKISFKESRHKLTILLFDKHPVLGTMLFMIIVRIPYFIAFYPCTLSWDGLYMLKEWIGLDTYTDHYPPLMTAIYGSVWDLGGKIGNRYLMLFLFVLLQSLLTAWAVGILIAMLKKLKIPYGIRWGVLAFYVLFTVWNIYSITLIIDSMYWPVTILYMAQMIAFILDRSRFDKIRNVLLLCLTAIAMALIRNNGIFVFLLTIPFIFFMVKRKAKLYLVAATALVIAAMTLMSHVVYPLLGVVPSFKYDTFCVCYQQTARFLVAHKDELPEDERAFLEQAMDIDEVVEHYSPYLADEVKWRMNWGVVSSRLDEYLSIWFKQGLRDPVCYIQSYLNSCTGYYYPSQPEYEDGLGWYGTHPYDVRKEGYVEINYAKETQGLREWLTNLPYDLRQLPGISMLYSCGFYTWIIIIVVAVILIKKRYCLILPVLPGVINILVCSVSPVNPHIRYTMPTMAAAVAAICMLCYAIMYTSEKEKQCEQKHA